MGTSFDTIYDRALARFRDYNWLKYSDEDKEYLLRNYLYSAQADFTNLSNENIEDLSIYRFGLTKQLSKYKLRSRIA